MSNQEQLIPRDEFSTQRRRLEGHPEADKTSSRLDVADDYGNVVTWVLDTYKVEGQLIALVQRISADGSVRMVLPPEVTGAFTRQHSNLATKTRKRIARRIVADKRATGQKLGNPAALALARKARKTKGGQ